MGIGGGRLAEVKIDFVLVRQIGDAYLQGGFAIVGFRDEVFFRFMAPNKPAGALQTDDPHHVNPIGVHPSFGRKLIPAVDNGPAGRRAGGSIDRDEIDCAPFHRPAIETYFTPKARGTEARIAANAQKEQYKACQSPTGTALGGFPRSR